jgi:predicted nucleic acid-binding protein
MEQVVYDSGALIAIDRRRDDLSLRRHQHRIRQGDHIMVPAPVAAQVIRDPGRQARLMLALQSCDMVPFGQEDAGPVGRLLAQSGTSDVVDGFVAVTAAVNDAIVVTSDPDDIERLLRVIGIRVPVLPT